jgi:hypothetical protein
MEIAARCKERGKGRCEEGEKMGPGMRGDAAMQILSRRLELCMKDISMFRRHKK